MKDFIPYRESLALKDVGFDEPCFAYYDYFEDINDGINTEKLLFIAEEFGVQFTSDLTSEDFILRAPTYSQAFKWLYQKLGIEKGVMPLDTESQQLLLKELIDKVSSKRLLA